MAWRVSEICLVDEWAVLSVEPDRKVYKGIFECGLYPEDLIFEAA